MKPPNRKSKKLVDQVFDRDRGWVQLSKAMPLRRLWWRDKESIMRHVEAVHFVELGDFKLSELR